MKNKISSSLWQRMKAAIHFSVGRFCEDRAATQQLPVSPLFIGVLSEATYSMINSMSEDLELFSK